MNGTMIHLALFFYLTSASILFNIFFLQNLMHPCPDDNLQFYPLDFFPLQIEKDAVQKSNALNYNKGNKGEEVRKESSLSN